MRSRKSSISLKIKTQIVIGWLGADLDKSGRSGERSTKWRPTLSLVQHPEFPIYRFELLHQPAHQSLAEEVRDEIKRLSPKTSVRLESVSLNDPRSFPEVYGQLYAYAQRYPFDCDKEEYFVHLTTGTHVAQICLFLLAEKRILPVHLLQTSPPGGYEILDLGSQDFERIRLRVQVEAETSASDAYLKDGITTRNPKFNTLIQDLTHVALNSCEPILLLGPTGAGKSKLAQRLYELKRNKQQFTGEFVPVNCATIRGEAAMSTLFGHKKGSFTGAHVERSGLLKTAHEGLLFLDEIGELGLEEQAMLLRAIEEKTFRPFGSDQEIESDFQLIAGTNSDLKQLVKQRRFREDLLARIDHWKFTLPSLRERAEDIEPNLAFELAQYAKHKQMHLDFTPEARRKLLDFAGRPEAVWKRNFRDLRRAVDRMGTFAKTGRITSEMVAEEINRLREDWREPVEQEVSVLTSLLKPEKLEALDLFERIQLEGVIKVCLKCRNLREAGRLLYAQSRERKTSANDSDRLGKYLKKYALEWHMIQALQINEA